MEAKPTIATNAQLHTERVCRGDSRTGPINGGAEGGGVGVGRGLRARVPAVPGVAGGVSDFDGDGDFSGEGAEKRDPILRTGDSQPEPGDSGEDF